MKRFLSIFLLCIFCCSLVLPTAQAATLTDLQGHWSAGDVNKLIDRGSVGGYPDGTFHPDATITRAEFSKILRQSLGLTSVAGNDFADTARHWAVSDIHTLVVNNIIVPAEYGSSYGPDSAIPRREIAIMLVRALGLNDDAINLAGQATSFTDDANIKSYDKGYLYLAKELGLVGGYEDGAFRPNNRATRAEACVMIVRLLNMKGADTDNAPQPTPPVDQNQQPSAGDNPDGQKADAQYQLTLQNVATSSRNILGEQYVSATLQLIVRNQSSQAITVSNETLKTIVTYSSGAQVTVKQKPFQQTIAAGQSKTIASTVEILLPNNDVANIVLGNCITNIQVQFTAGNQTLSFDDVNTALLQAVQ